MRKIEIELFSIEELSTQARENAFKEWTKDGGYDSDWSNEHLDTIKAALEVFNITIKDYSVDVSNCSPSWVKYEFSNEYGYTGNNAYTTEETFANLFGLRLRKFLLNNFYGLLYAPKSYGKYVGFNTTTYTIPRTIYKHQRDSKILFTDSDCPFTGACFDMDFLDVFRAFIKAPDNRTFKDLIDQAIQDVFKNMWSEYEYKQSFEYFEQDAIGNGYEFTSDGTRYIAD